MNLFVQYTEIIYNSPYSDQGQSKEPIDYSYLPYKSIVRALVKHVQTKIGEGADHLYEPSVVTALDILASPYSKPLPPLNWSFLINTYLSTNPAKTHIAPSKTNTAPSKTHDAPAKSISSPSEISPAPSKTHDAPSETSPAPSKTDLEPHLRKLALIIAAQNCPTSQETCRSLATYLTRCIPQLSEASILAEYLPHLCQHLDSTVFQDYFDSTMNQSRSNQLEFERESCEQNFEERRGESKEHTECSEAFALYAYYKGIKQCLVQLGPSLTALHLPPSTNLESNIFYLSSTVCQMYEKYSTRNLGTTVKIQTDSLKNEKQGVNFSNKKCTKSESKDCVSQSELVSVILHCIPHIPPLIRHHPGNQATPLPASSFIEKLSLSV
ncbi:hypothetical protein WDU94_000202 [Cyamophila willieti]